MNLNTKISGRDLGFLVVGVGICAIVLHKYPIKPLRQSNKDLSETNDKITNDCECLNLKCKNLEKELGKSEEERAKLIVENRHKDDEIKSLRDENQFYRDNYNNMSGANL